MRVDVPDDLAKCTIVELRDVARMARELDIAAQVELSRRSESVQAAQHEARFAGRSPVARKAVEFLEGYGGGKRGKWTMLALAAAFAVLFNARHCVDAAGVFADHVQQANEALQPPPVEVKQ
jgi:hypothetical protein